MTDNSNNTSFLSDLFKRRVPHILFIYSAGCWTIIQIVEWIIGRYLISPHLTDLCLVAMVSFIPSIALIAYFHGTPGRDEWHPIEKIGIPINLFASLLILFISFYPKDLGAITETIVVENELGHKMEKVIPKREFRKKVSIFNFRNLSENEDVAWVSLGLLNGILIDHADELMTNLRFGQNHYLAWEKNYLPNDELPLNLMLDIARQYKHKYMFFGDHSMDDDVYDVTTYIYDVNTSRLVKERNYRNGNLFTIIDNISHDLKMDMEIPEQYLKTAKDLPFNEICTKSMDAYKEFSKARYSILSNLYVEAEAHLNKSLEHDDKFAFAYKELLGTAYRTNKGKDEFEHYSNMYLNTMHNIPELYQRNAKIYHAKNIEKDFEKAKMIIEMEIKLNPDDLSIRMELVSIYRHQMELEKAIKGLEYCYSIDPDSKYLLSIMSFYSTMREYAKALEYANMYMDKYPDDDLGYLKASRYYGNMGNVQKEKDYLFKCIIIDPEFIWGECALDYLSYELKEINYEELTGKYHAKIRRSHTDRDKSIIYINLAKFYSMHGLIDSVIYHTDLAISLRPTESTYNVSIEYLSFILYYMNMGREELAKEIFEKYGGKGHIGESDLSQAIIYLYDNEFQKAHQFINDQVEKTTLEGNLFQLYNHHFLKGLIYQKSNDHENAIIAFEKLLQFPPGNFYYHSLERQSDELVFLLMSQSYHQLGDMKSAREWIEKAYRIDSFRPRIQYQMALLEHDDGNHEKAMEYLEYCLEIWKHADDDFPPLMEAREKLRSWNQIN